MLDQTIFQRMAIGIKGYTEKEMSIAYGIFSTKAVVITNIPIALANAVSSAMMPGLAGHIARKDKNKYRSIFHITVKMQKLFLRHLMNSVSIIPAAKIHLISGLNARTEWAHGNSLISCLLRQMS